MGSWKTIAIFDPLYPLHLLLGELEQILPLEDGLTALDDAVRLGKQPHDALGR